MHASIQTAQQQRLLSQIQREARQVPSKPHHTGRAQGLIHSSYMAASEKMPASRAMSGEATHPDPIPGEGDAQAPSATRFSPEEETVSFNFPVIRLIQSQYFQGFVLF